MSWFDAFASLERASRVPLGCEIAPGVVLARRQFICGALASALALGAGCRSTGPRLLAIEDREAALEDFVRTMRPRARQLVSSGAIDEERYLEYVARSLQRLPTPSRGVDGLEAEQWDMQSLCWFRPIAVFEMRLAPGALLELHDHRDYNGVLSCVRGSVRCANFDILGEVEAARSLEGEAPFQVVKLNDQSMKVGSTSTLSRSHRNLHELEAGPDGAVLYDAFTYFREDGRSHGVKLGPPIPGNPGRFEARWKVV